MICLPRTLELFVESLLTKSMQITQARNAKTLTPSHMKQCILSESRFDFLKDLVKNIPDASVQEDNENNAIFELDDKQETSTNTSPNPQAEKLDISANFYSEQSTSSSRTPVIQYGPKVAQAETKLTFPEPKLHITIASETNSDNVPPLIPISHNVYSQNVSDNLCIDEDYDN